MEKPKLAFKQLLFVVIIFAGLYLYGPKSSSMFSVSGETMGTYYVVKADSSQIKELATEIDQILIDFNQIFSTYIKTSEISRWNSKQTTSPLTISRNLYSLAERAQQYCRLSQGYYDITIQNLVNAWGFGPHEIDSAPAPARIDELLQTVGCDKFELLKESRQLRKKNPQVQLDFSSIAKGLAVDEIYKFVLSKGLINFIVEIGGELRVSGQPGKSRKYYNIGINRPDENSATTDIAEILLLENGEALATSGNYRNMLKDGGLRWAHILNPLVGKPQKSDVLSASIISSECAEADAIATMAMSLGSSKAIGILDELNVQYLLITREPNTGKAKIFRSQRLKWLKHES